MPFTYEINVEENDQIVKKIVNIDIRPDSSHIKVFNVTTGIVEDDIIENEVGKPVFASERKETVVELTGLASDKISHRSWAIARFEKDGSSDPHLHEQRYEIYFVTQGQATVILADIDPSSQAPVKPLINKQEYVLRAGASIVIPKGKAHQVFNDGDVELVLAVPCYPAWIYEDKVTVEESRIIDSAAISTQVATASDAISTQITPLYSGYTARKPLAPDLSSAAVWSDLPVDFKLHATRAELLNIITAKQIIAEKHLFISSIPWKELLIRNLERIFVVNEYDGIPVRHYGVFQISDTAENRLSAQREMAYLETGGDWRLLAHMKEIYYSSNPITDREDLSASSPLASAALRKARI